MKPLVGARRRSGFTLLEATIVSALMAFLAVLVSAAWSGFGRPAADIAEHCHVAQEANLAVASLTSDFAGSLSEDRTGSKTKFKVVGRMQPANSQVRLCFDGGSSPNGLADWGSPDIIITYEVQSNKLIRWNETSGATFTVARDVDQLEATDLGGGKVEIKLTFKYRKITQMYTLIARDP